MQNWRKLEPRIVDHWMMRERGHDRYENSREGESSLRSVRSLEAAPVLEGSQI